MSKDGVNQPTKPNAIPRLILKIVNHYTGRRIQWEISLLAPDDDIRVKVAEAMRVYKNSRGQALWQVSNDGLPIVRRIFGGEGQHRFCGIILQVVS